MYDDDDWNLFDGVPDIPHARNTDPEASHEAAALLSTGKSHCRALLNRWYAAGPRGLTDDEAGQLADIDRDGWGKRCADLRRLGCIEWVRDDDGKIMRRMGSAGRMVGISVITVTGRNEFERTQ